MKFMSFVTNISVWYLDELIKCDEKSPSILESHVHNAIGYNNELIDYITWSFPRFLMRRSPILLVLLHCFTCDIFQIKISFRKIVFTITIVHL